MRHSSTSLNESKSAAKAGPSHRSARLGLFGLSLAAAGVFGCVTAAATAWLIHLALPLLGMGEADERFRAVLFVIVASFVFSLYRAVFALLAYRAELPEGVYVTPENGAALWRGVTDICAAAGIAPPDRIVLTPEMNAFAAEVPTRGIFRRKERVLGLGYPLLALLSLEQGCAVIAHELAHLRNRDSRSSLFHDSVEHLMSTITAERDDGILRRIVCLPGNLYAFLAARLGAHVKRLHEYSADALAGELLGRQTAAEALVTVDVLGEAFEQTLWKPLADAWEKGAEMPASILDAIADRARAPASRALLQQRLDRALTRKTERYDTHPALADRIAALGVAPALPTFAAEMTAARGLLWQDEPRLSADLDRLIRENLGARFEARAAEVSQVRGLLGRFEPALLDGTASRDQAEVASLLLERTVAAAEARDLHETILRRYGDIPSSVCELAHDKLERQDVQGAEELLAAAARHPMMAAAAMEFLQWADRMAEAAEHDWAEDALWLRGWATDGETRRRIREALAAHAATMERFGALDDAKQPLAPHGLETWHVEMIVGEVRKLYDAQHIWLARMVVDTDFPATVFRMLIAVKGEATIVPVSLVERCCLPGPLRYLVIGALDVPPAAARTLRDYRPGLIYTAAARETTPAMAA